MHAVMYVCTYLYIHAQLCISVYTAVSTYFCLFAYCADMQSRDDNALMLMSDWMLDFLHGWFTMRVLFQISSF